jgi:hypothetical protein
MLSKRVLVLAADRALQKRLAAAAMAAGAAAQTVASLDDATLPIAADVALVAATGNSPGATVELIATRLPAATRLVLLIDAPDLEATVALLALPRVAAVLVQEDLAPATVTALLCKLLERDLFGVDKLMPWGVRAYSLVVGDYEEKSQAITTVAEFAQALGVRRKYRELIEQCLDEMLMNALYDAPVDAAGKPLFADVPVKERVLMRVEEKAVVQYACDGERFALSVRDAFGTLEKATVVRYLDKCLHAPVGQQIDRKTGGAGLGLYLIANAASEVHFHIFSGAGTEAACAFDLTAPRAQLRAFAVLVEPGEAIPRAEPPPPPPRRSALLPVMMTFAVLLLLFSVGLAAWPYLRPPPAASLHVTSDPPGVTVYLDGRARGTTPLDVAGLEVQRSYAVRATRPGFHDDEQVVTTLAGTSEVRLRLAELKAQLTIASDPAGARLSIDGKSTGQLTPATLELAPNQPINVRLDKDSFVARELALTAPGPGERATLAALLALSPATALLSVTAEPETATVSVDGQALTPPAPSHDSFVAPGSRHRLVVTAPGFVAAQKDVSLGAGEHKTVRVVLVAGGTLALTLNLPARVLVDDKAVGVAPLPPLGLAPGEHTLGLRGADRLSFSTPIRIDKGETLEVRLELKPDRTVSGHVGARRVAGTW